jgi:alkylation response protein AidB-like acyl-CoA dehydrogenase
MIKFGTDAQKRKHLPGICAARRDGLRRHRAERGTDTSRIQTAREAGRPWIVNGRKVWTTNAQHANKFLLLARERASAIPPSRSGHDALLHRLRPQGHQRALIHKLGRAAVDSNEIVIENLEVRDAT